MLSPSVTILSTTVHDNLRTVVLRRGVKGLTSDHYNFPTAAGDVNLISAIGEGPELVHHKSQSGGKITLLPSSGSACVCQSTASHYLTYMDTATKQWAEYDCMDEPRGDMLRRGDGTGRNVPNQACQMATYHGGLQCCNHGWFLTDRAQDSQIPRDKVDTYYLKFRFYFQEYQPASLGTPNSHAHLHGTIMFIDAQIDDYEEDNVEYGKKSVGKISAHLKARDMGILNNDGAAPIPANLTTMTPLVLTPHCHAPSCIRQELWNADTGEIICNNTAAYGDKTYGSTDSVFNEKDYIALLPCIYGHQPGLQFPFNLNADTNLTAVKYFNNTYRHMGQMAQWTGLWVYNTDPY